MGKPGGGGMDSPTFELGRDRPGGGRMDEVLGIEDGEARGTVEVIGLELLDTGALGLDWDSPRVELGYIPGKPVDEGISSISGSLWGASKNTVSSMI